MYLVAVALCAALSLVDISGAQDCVDGSILDDDVCLKLTCKRGSWKYLGGGVESKCGHCTVIGDPHITTYDPHNLINGNNKKNGNPIKMYEVPGGFDAKYAISQIGKDMIPSIGVSAHFKECLYNKSCVSTVYYNEPGIEVELILPKKVATVRQSSGDLYCQNRPPTDPDCATKIKVIIDKFIIHVGGSVSSWSGNAGKVWIIKEEGCNSQSCQIYVVGTQGITVSLLVDPFLPSTAMYKLNVHSTPSVPNSLFGLCDTFTGTTTNHYTPRYGPTMTRWNDKNIGDFIETWKIGCMCAFEDTGSCSSGCVITEAAPVGKACQCSQHSAREFPEYCFGTVVNCIDQTSSACANPNTDYESCLQGQGNCGGYDEKMNCE